MVRPKQEASSSPGERSEWWEGAEHGLTSMGVCSCCLACMEQLTGARSLLRQFSWIPWVSTCAEVVWTEKTWILACLWGIFSLSVWLSAWGGSPCSFKARCSCEQEHCPGRRCTAPDYLPAAELPPCTATQQTSATWWLLVCSGSSRKWAWSSALE